jgi:hypothetical protein
MLFIAFAELDAEMIEFEEFVEAAEAEIDQAIERAEEERRGK